MSGPMMTWARTQTTGNPTSKAVLLLIAELVNDEGETSRSQRYIAETLEIHYKTAGRALAHLEEMGFLRRERRQAGPTNRLTDKLHLQVTRVEFQYMTPEEDAAREAQTVGNAKLPTGESVGNGEFPYEGNAALPNVGNGEFPIKEKPLETPLETPLGETALFEAEGSTAVAVREKNLKQEANIIAKRATEASNGSLPFMGMRGIADHFLHQGFSTDQVLTAMGNLWKNGRSVNRQSVGQVLQGIIRPDGSRPRKSTAQRNLEAGIRAIEILKAEEEAQEAGR